MDKISVSVISHKTNEHITNKVLNVNTICEKKKKNIDIIEQNNKIRQKLVDIYVSELNKCKKRIYDLNSRRKHDLTYSVPNIILSLPEYKSTDCVDYIYNKLYEEGYDLDIINKTDIFITWYYYEINNLEKTD